MAVKDFLFTSESVSEGHPDKLCDQVSDAILDAHLAGDPNSRVACESLAKTGMVVVAGEITSNAKVSYVDVVRDVDPYPIGQRLFPMSDNITERNIRNVYKHVTARSVAR